MKGDTEVMMAISFFIVGAYLGVVIERDGFPVCGGTALGVAVGLFTGVVAGIYAGVVVARMARFEEIRHQIRKVVLGFDYIYSGNGEPELRGSEHIPVIHYAASDFFYLGHKMAGDAAMRILNKMTDASCSPPSHSKEMEEIMAGVYEETRKLKPNYPVVLSLRPWV